MSKIIISKVNGKWLINGKPYNQINDKEKKFFDEFLLFMRWEQGKGDHDEKLKKVS